MRFDLGRKRLHPANVDYGFLVAPAEIDAIVHDFDKVSGVEPLISSTAGSGVGKSGLDEQSSIGNADRRRPLRPVEKGLRKSGATILYNDCSSRFRRCIYVSDVSLGI